MHTAVKIIVPLLILLCLIFGYKKIKKIHVSRVPPKTTQTTVPSIKNNRSTPFPDYGDERTPPSKTGYPTVTENNNQPLLHDQSLKDLTQTEPAQKKSTNLSTPDTPEKQSTWIDKQPRTNIPLTENQNDYVYKELRDLLENSEHLRNEEEALQKLEQPIVPPLALPSGHLHFPTGTIHTPYTPVPQEHAPIIVPPQNKPLPKEPIVHQPKISEITVPTIEVKKDTLSEQTIQKPGTIRTQKPSKGSATPLTSGAVETLFPITVGTTLLPRTHQGAVTVLPKAESIVIIPKKGVPHIALERPDVRYGDTSVQYFTQQGSLKKQFNNQPIEFLTQRPASEKFIPLYQHTAAFSSLPTLKLVPRTPLPKEPINIEWHRTPPVERDFGTEIPKIEFNTERLSEHTTQNAGKITNQKSSTQPITTVQPAIVEKSLPVTMGTKPLPQTHQGTITTIPKPEKIVLIPEKGIPHVSFENPHIRYDNVPVAYVEQKGSVKNQPTRLFTRHPAPEFFISPLTDKNNLAGKQSGKLLPIEYPRYIAHRHMPPTQTAAVIHPEKQPLNSEWRDTLTVEHDFGTEVPKIEFGKETLLERTTQNAGKKTNNYDLSTQLASTMQPPEIVWAPIKGTNEPLIKNSRDVVQKIPSKALPGTEQISLSPEKAVYRVFEQEPIVTIEYNKNTSSPSLHEQATAIPVPEEYEHRNPTSIQPQQRTLFPPKDQSTMWLINKNQANIKQLLQSTKQGTLSNTLAKEILHNTNKKIAYRKKTATTIQKKHTATVPKTKRENTINHPQKEITTEGKRVHRDPQTIPLPVSPDDIPLPQDPFLVSEAALASTLPEDPEEKLLALQDNALRQQEYQLQSALEKQKIKDFVQEYLSSHQGDSDVRSFVQEHIIGTMLSDNTLEELTDRVMHDIYQTTFQPIAPKNISSPVPHTPLRPIKQITTQSSFPKKPLMQPIVSKDMVQQSLRKLLPTLKKIGKH